MVVRSESMKPSFHVGDILVSYSIHLDGYCSKQVNDNKIDEVLKKGDVVVLQVNVGRYLIKTLFMFVFTFNNIQIYKHSMILI